MLKASRIFPLVLLCGCFSAPEREGEVVVSEGGLPVPFEVVGEGATAAVAGTVEVAVREAQAWDTLRSDLAFRRPVPPVDLTGAMLLVAVAPMPQSGHALRFESVEEDSAGVVATYTLFTPAADCITDARPQQPFQVVRLRNVEGPVRFVRHEEALSCSLDRW